MKENTKGSRTPDMEYESRFERVYEMMLYEHLGYNEFKQKAAKEFDISTRAAENIWKEARTRLKERFDRNSDEILQDQLNRLYDLLNRCRLNNNRKVESEVLRDLNKLYGLEAAKKVDLTTNGQPISININMTE